MALTPHARRMIIAALALSATGCSGVRDAQVARYENHRVQQAVQDYEAERADPVGRCVAAKMVSTAYADAGARSEAEAWAAREAADCRAAYAAMGLGTPPAE